ncbi:MAG TPA: DUF1579 family protein [Candidatus Sulfotelmatobacter sp.]
MKKAGTILAVFLLGVSAVAQMEAPKPTSDLKKLDMFAGSWTLTGDMKPGPMGPGGKMSETEKCEWMQGGFYVVCHDDYKSSMGDGVGISVLGYSPDDHAYTYREFNSQGEFDDSKGTIDGDTWNWTNESKMGGMTMKGKYTMKIVSPTSYTFDYQISQDGTKWTPVMDGKATKK